MITFGVTHWAADIRLSGELLPAGDSNRCFSKQPPPVMGTTLQLKEKHHGYKQAYPHRARDQTGR